MDITKMLSELRTERATIEEAILTLERLARGSGRRRGRPPKWMSDARSQVPSEASASTRRKRVVSPEARARMAAAQRKRWARREEAGK